MKKGNKIDDNFCSTKKYANRRVKKIKGSKSVGMLESLIKYRRIFVQRRIEGN